LAVLTTFPLCVTAIALPGFFLALAASEQNCPGVALLVH
jgi:hypothetical protein